jgi:foldase protein PrsA
MDFGVQSRSSLLYWSRAAQREASAATGAFSMKTLRLAILPLAAGALLAAGCGGGGGGSLGANDVAQVGNVTISKAQFDQLMQQARKAYAAQHQVFPAQTSSQYQGLKDQAVQFLVQRAEYEQEGKDLGVNVSQKQIADRMKQIAKTYYGGSEAKMFKQLAKEHVTRATVEGRIKDQLLQQALYNKVTAAVKVKPSEIRAQYNQQYRPTRVVRHILVKSRRLAFRLDNHLKADHGKDFAQLAKKYSKDPSSASQGGKLTISKGQTVMQFDTMAFMLGTGTISNPVHTQFGWHIIQPLSKVKPVTPFSQVKEPIKQQLLSQTKQQVMQKWVTGLKKKFKPTYQKGYAPAPSAAQPQSQPQPQPSTTG